MGKSIKGKELGRGITQRADGRYMARLMVKGKQKTLYDFNLKALKEKLQDEKRNILQDTLYEMPTKEITLNEWFDEWYENYKKPTLKNSGSYSYISRFKNFYGVRLGPKGLKDIRQLHVQSVIAELKELGYAASTIREATGILQNCLDAAVANGYININPANGVIVPKMGKVERRVLTVQEQRRFLDHIHNVNSWYEEMYNIMFLTGMRIGEVGGLQWQDIDFENKFIHIRRSLFYDYDKGKKKLFLTSPKTENSCRLIPFFGETKAFFISQQKKQEQKRKERGSSWRAQEEFGELVFTTSLGSPIGRYVVERDMRYVVEQINTMELMEAQQEGRMPVKMERIYPHAVRHTFATRCFEKGMSARTVQEIMGHANYNTTVNFMQWNQKQSILEGVMTVWDTSKKQGFYKKCRHKSGIG